MGKVRDSIEEAARLIRAGASLQGPYVLEHCIVLAGADASLSPRQSIRIARRERKTIPSEIMDRLRALYTETCEALDDKAASLNEETHAAIEERRRRCEGVDGERACPARATDRSAEADPRLND